MKKTKKDFLENWSTNPRLAKAVFNQMGASWAKIKEYPMDYRDASAGVPGFIYYSETVPFAKRNMVEIARSINQFEQDCGILDKPTDDETQYFNWCAWFALEATI